MRRGPSWRGNGPLDAGQVARTRAIGHHGASVSMSAATAAAEIRVCRPGKWGHQDGAEPAGVDERCWGPEVWRPPYRRVIVATPACCFRPCQRRAVTVFDAPAFVASYWKLMRLSRGANSH